MKHTWLRLTLVGALMAMAVAADPPWWSSHMESADCDDVFWKMQGNCLLEFHTQEVERLRHYVRVELENRPASTFCPLPELIQTFNEREAAWDEYGRLACNLENFCADLCGTGHTPAFYGCLAERMADRARFLRRELTEGMALYGCPLPPVAKVKRLRTERFDVRLTSLCDGGLLECDAVRYEGRHRARGESIELQGREFFTSGPDIELELPEGFIFENGEIQYLVFHSGKLKVIDRSSGEVLVEEVGRWQEAP